MDGQGIGGPGWVLGGGLFALVALVGGATIAATQIGSSRRVQGGVDAWLRRAGIDTTIDTLSADESEYDKAMAHVQQMQEAVERGADVRTLRNHKGPTFQEWAKAAGWSQAAKKLTGMGYEDAEISWQTGEDPPAVRAQAQKDAWDLATFLNRPQLDREAAHEAAMEAAGRERALQAVNRALIPGIASPTKEAQLAVLLAELDQITGRRGPR